MNYTMYQRRGYEGRKTVKPSFTVPNQVKTLAEMLARVSRGFPLMQNSNLQYGEDEELQPTFNDLTDLDDAKAYINEVKEKVSKDKKDRLQRTPTSEEGNNGQSIAE